MNNENIVNFVLEMSKEDKTITANKLDFLLIKIARTLPRLFLFGFKDSCYASILSIVYKKGLQVFQNSFLCDSILQLKPIRVIARLLPSNTWEKQAFLRGYTVWRYENAISSPYR